MSEPIDHDKRHRIMNELAAQNWRIIEINFEGMTYDKLLADVTRMRPGKSQAWREDFTQDIFDELQKER